MHTGKAVGGPESKLYLISKHKPNLCYLFTRIMHNCETKTRRMGAARTNQRPHPTRVKITPPLPIVVSAIDENDFVSGLQPQANWAEECLDATARIKRRIHVIRSEIIHATG